MEQERRSTVRYAVELEIRVNGTVGIATNISDGGVYLTTAVPVLPEEKLCLMFPLEHAAPGSRAECSARVLRVDQRSGRREAGSRARAFEREPASALEGEFRVNVVRQTSQQTETKMPARSALGSFGVSRALMPAIQVQTHGGRRHRQRASLCAIVLGAALSAPGCANPVAPVPEGEGIIIFENQNYGGGSEALNQDVSNLEFLDGPCRHREAARELTSWGDCISSVQVNPGWTATFYSDDSFKGRSFTATADVPDLDAVRGPCRDTFNDCISSIRVSKLQ